MFHWPTSPIYWDTIFPLPHEPIYNLEQLERKASKNCNRSWVWRHDPNQFTFIPNIYSYVLISWLLGFKTTTNTPNYIYPKLIIHRIYFDKFWSIFIHHYPFLPISSIFINFFPFYPFHPRLSISTHHIHFHQFHLLLSTLINFYPFRSFIHVYPFSSDIISFHPLIS